MIKQSKRRVEISKARNKRGINLAASHLSLDSTDTRAQSVICHRHLYGWVLILLNRENLPIRIWTTVNGFEPFRAILITEDKVRNIVLRHKPKTIHLNDCSLLVPTTDFANTQLIAYTESLYEYLETLKKEAEVAQRIRDRLNRTNNTPRFETIKALDPSITYAEYAKIYNLDT